MIKRLLPPLLQLFTIGFVFAQAPDSTATNSSAQYLANEGLMVVHGETKVVFDPLFRNSYGQYQLLPKPMEEALYAGAPPFDGIDAVFVSHTPGCRALTGPGSATDPAFQDRNYASSKN